MVPRDFEYSEEAFKHVEGQRAKLEEDCKRHFDLVKALYKAAWSDTIVSWVHLKAMRIYVESVLRYGMPPRFSAFIVPPKPTALPVARKSLAAILGQGQPGAFGGDQKGDGDDDDDFYPYVSLSLTPFTTARG